MPWISCDSQNPLLFPFPNWGEEVLNYVNQAEVAELVRDRTITGEDKINPLSATEQQTIWGSSRWSCLPRPVRLWKLRFANCHSFSAARLIPGLRAAQNIQHAGKASMWKAPYSLHSVTASAWLCISNYWWQLIKSNKHMCKCWWRKIKLNSNKIMPFQALITLILACCHNKLSSLGERCEVLQSL